MFSINLLPWYFYFIQVDDVDKRLERMKPSDAISGRPRQLSGNIGHLKGLVFLCLYTKSWAIRLNNIFKMLTIFT